MVDKRMEKIEHNAVLSLEQLVTELKSLKREVDEYNRNQLESNRIQQRRFWLNLAATIIVLIVMVGGIFVVMQVGTLSHQIADCIQTSGTCYQSTQRRTGGAVQFLAEEQRRTILAANWCSAAEPKPASLAAFAACVDDVARRVPATKAD